MSDDSDALLDKPTPEAIEEAALVVTVPADGTGMIYLRHGLTPEHAADWLRRMAASLDGPEEGTVEP